MGNPVKKASNFSFDLLTLISGVLISCFIIASHGNPKDRLFKLLFNLSQTLHPDSYGHSLPFLQFLDLIVVRFTFLYHKQIRFAFESRFVYFSELRLFKPTKATQFQSIAYLTMLLDCSDDVWIKGKPKKMWEFFKVKLNQITIKTVPLLKF